MYKALNLPYQNPFIFTRIWADDFLKLLREFDTIDFENYILNTNSGRLVEEVENFHILLDDKIKIYFKHHRFRSTANSLEFSGPNMYYNKVWEYLIKKWDERIKNLFKNKSKKIIVLDNQKGCYSSIIDPVMELCKIKNYKLVIIDDRIKIPDRTGILLLRHKTEVDPNSTILENLDQLRSFINDRY